MMRWRHAPTCQKASLLTLIAVAIGLSTLITAEFVEEGSDIAILTAILLTGAGCVAALFLIIDRWARYNARAFRVGYIVRDMDDAEDIRLPQQRPARLHVVELPREQHQP